MAEIIVSAVVGETVGAVLSSVIRKAEEKTSLSENIERLEIAHVKMEAALDMSNKWQISSMPLLRWRSKLKRAAQECDDTLRQCKQRAIEEEAIGRHIKQSSFPKRIAYSARSLVLSFIPFSKDESTGSSANNIRKFERYADGANEFIKFVEFGGTPRQYMFFDPFIGHLLAGKSLRYQVLKGSKFLYVGIRSMHFVERGVEAMVGFVHIDFKDPLKGLRLFFVLRLADSTDIIGVMVKCMQSVTPHFTSASERFKEELIQLPTQDFSILSSQSPYAQSEFWSNLHNTVTQWCRPNPLCCNEHDLTPCSSTSNIIRSSSLSSRLLSGIFPEEVILVVMQCHILLPEQRRNRQSSATSTLDDTGGASSLNPHMQPLKLGVLFIPHDSPEDTDPTAESYALEVIDEKEHDMIHWNTCLKDLDEKLVPKAIDYLYQNAESKVYQMCLKARHGTAHFCVEKTSTEMRRSRRSKATRGAHNRRVHIQDKRSEDWKKLVGELLKLRVVRDRQARRFHQVLGCSTKCALDVHAILRHTKIEYTIDAAEDIHTVYTDAFQLSAVGGGT